MTVRVELPDGSISEPISNKFLVKYAPAGEIKTRFNISNTRNRSYCLFLNTGKRVRKRPAVFENVVRNILECLMYLLNQNLN